jgi:hypothetical protein
LFERVKSPRITDEKKPARDFSDYDILLDDKSICPKIFWLVSVE